MLPLFCSVLFAWPLFIVFGPHEENSEQMKVKYISQWHEQICLYLIMKNHMYICLFNFIKVRSRSIVLLRFTSIVKRSLTLFYS